MLIVSFICFISLVVAWLFAASDDPAAAPAFQATATLDRSSPAADHGVSPAG